MAGAGELPPLAEVVPAGPVEGDGADDHALDELEAAAGPGLAARHGESELLEAVEEEQRGHAVALDAVGREADLHVQGGTEQKDTKVELWLMFELSF